MKQHHSQAVKKLADVAAEYLSGILSHFKDGAKITLLVRTPDKPDGSQDLILTTDTLDDAITALTLRKTAPTIEGRIDS